MKKLLPLLLVLANFVSLAQDNPTIFRDQFVIKGKKHTKRALEDVYYGDKFYVENTQGGYLWALENYLPAYEYNPNNAALNYKIGVCYLNSIYKDKALQYLKKAYKLNRHVAKDIYWWLGLAYAYNYQFDTAITHLEKYKSTLNAMQMITWAPKIDKKILECYNAKKMVNNPVKVKIENVENVNSPYPDYCPIITADESEMYFTSRRPGGMGDKIDPYDGQYYEDIYVSQFENGQWQKPYNAGIPLNTGSHDATVGLTPDGRKMIIYRDGDLYISVLKGKKWTYPEPLPPTINTDKLETHAAFSYDGKTLYFIRGRMPYNVQSNGDIYVTHWNGKTWTTPKRLPDNINTPYDEAGVYMMHDGKTLYFSSKGHNTMGGYDLFVTYKIDDTTWADPVNLGYPINTPDDDLYITFTADGKTAYYSSVRKDTKGFSDIYKITFEDKTPLMLAMEENNKKDTVNHAKKLPAPEADLALVVGHVKDPHTGKPISAEIEIYDINKDSLVIRTESNPTDGKFLVTLPSGKNYSMYIKRDKYLFYSENFDLPKDEGFKKKEIDVKLNKVEKGAKTTLRNLFFDFNKATLRPESYPELKQLATFLRNHPEIKIEIVGHTDNVGSWEYNKKLSEARAKAVADYLIKLGIPASRIKYRGASYDEPIADNSTEEGREKNRRVEIIIIDD